MNKGLKGFLVAILLALLSLLGYNGVQNLGSSHVGKQVIAGTTSQYVLAPTSTYAFLNADTTTNGYHADTFTQVVPTTGADKVSLNVSAIAGTATSTLWIRPYVSYDGSYYYELSTTTLGLLGDTLQLAPTSTVQTLPLQLSWDPGLATSSKRFVFENYGAKYWRFTFATEDVAADPDDGVSVYVEAIIETENNR